MRLRVAILGTSIDAIECASEGRFWPSLCLWDKAASTKSTKSTRNPQNIHDPQNAQIRANASFPENIHEIHEIHGIPWMRVSCVRFHARKGASRKAHPVTICHRLREGPFFRVFGGQIRIDGFPFGLHRNPPKRAFFRRSHRCHRINQCSAHAMVSCAWDPGFRLESRSTPGHEFRIILSWPQRRLFPRF